jgi:hypothetical protein
MCLYSRIGKERIEIRSQEDENVEGSSTSYVHENQNYSDYIVDVYFVKIRLELV